jgi:tetratricopeptide (TPR) repeat protein
MDDGSSYRFDPPIGSPLQTSIDFGDDVSRVERPSGVRCLPLDDDLWPQLADAWNDGRGLSERLRELAGSDRTLASYHACELSARLCLGCDVFPATYAAIPHLAALAMQCSPQQRIPLLRELGHLLACSRLEIPSEVPVQILKMWVAAQQALVPVIAETFNQPLSEDDLRELMKAMAAAQGATGLAHVLGNLTCHVECPECHGFVPVMESDLNPAFVDNEDTSEATSEELEGEIRECTRALERDPEDTDAYRDRAYAWQCKGELGLAVQDLERVLVCDPDDVQALNDLAWIWATSTVDEIRDGRRALSTASRAVSLDGGLEGIVPSASTSRALARLEFIDSLAAAYAECGQFDDAVHCIRAVLPFACDSDYRILRDRVQLYEAQQPLRAD